MNDQEAIAFCQSVIKVIAEQRDRIVLLESIIAAGGNVAPAALDADTSGLSVRSRNCIRNQWEAEKREGRWTVDWLCSKTRDELLRIPGMGTVAVSSIEVWLSLRGRTLAKDYN